MMQNAGNDEFLEVVKKVSNKKIYNHVLKFITMNQPIKMGK